MRSYSALVPPELDGARVEQVLRRTLGLSATRIKRAKFQGDGITLDGVRVNTDCPVRAGQALTLRLPDRAAAELIPLPGALDVVFEDGWYLVVNKPAGLAVHPGPGHYADTLGNLCAHRARERGEDPAFRPVHRLDKGTSGLIVLAKGAEAHEALQAQLHTDGFCRSYLALTAQAPSPERGTIDAPIAPVAGALNRYCVHPDGKPARTDYALIGHNDRASLLLLRLHTGRTHQIRVHLAYLGCPLLGDTAYGGEPALGRPALHAHSLDLRHPFTGEALHLTAPLPADMAAFGLREGTP